ncbi:trifunctional dihydropteroate synthetase [Tulasnella sp. 419]|nr:trifunctional dihydropteroate synthetase [Tulasnella sp. 419]
MYVEDQARFINGACLVSTTLEPQGLLKLLKKVEADVGRTPTFRKGPRMVDLDIVLYDDLISSTRKEDGTSKENEQMDLVIPHERMQEREFVLRPLADIIPKFIHPRLNLTMQALLNNVVHSSSSSPRIRKVTPFLCSSDVQRPDAIHAPESSYLTWTAKTYIMAIINATPDSFSDGGDHFSVSAAMKFVKSLYEKQSSGETFSFADIIDIGGYSTRPGAHQVSESEEIARVVPIIRAIRNEGIKTPISIDTFRSEVAKAAIEAGADCINDVYGLTGEGIEDHRILEVTRKLGVPVILMHSRGDAGKNKVYHDVGGVLAGVRKELGRKMDRALKAGVRRWNIIADPGIGFSKSVDGNLTLVRDLRKFTAPVSSISPTRSLQACVHSVDPLSSMPVLAGASRKSFLGSVIGRENTAKDRKAASIATHTAAIQQGADIIRAHDVIETWDLVQVADKLWRSS